MSKRVANKIVATAHKLYTLNLHEYTSLKLGDHVRLSHVHNSGETTLKSTINGERGKAV